MKKMLFAILLLPLLLVASQVEAAKVLRFSWTYGVAEAAHLEGFRLYQNGVPVQTVGKDARMVETPYIEDREPRIYHLTAYTAEDESGPSDMITVPPYLRAVSRIASGTFTVEIIEVSQ